MKYVVLVVLLIPSLCFAQSTLTSFEKTYGEGIIKFYSGELPQVPADKSKVDAYVYGDDASKKAAVKSFIKDVILPSKQKNLIDLQNAVSKAEAEVQELQNYIK